MLESSHSGVRYQKRPRLNDAIEVVQWYKHQIYIKLMRAITGLMEDEKEVLEEPVQYPKNSDGSAKVALIGMDRSLAAWDIISHYFPSSHSHEISAILAHLESLRRHTERFFPDARRFMRPGFDLIDYNS